MSVLAMMKRKGTTFKLLFLYALIGLFCASFGNQITSADLLDPEIYAICSLGSCLSPPYGTSYCFDRRNKKPPGPTIDPSTPWKTLLLRGKLIAKTQSFAVFSMYKRYLVSWRFFFFYRGSFLECDTTFCSLEELRNADPELQGIRRGDNLCVIPLDEYERGRTTPNAVRAIEPTEVIPGGLLDCSARGGHARIRNKYAYF